MSILNLLTIGERGMQGRVMTKATRWGLIFFLWWGANASLCWAGDLSFNRDVRPILSDKCFMCHGPDAENREADLRFDVEQSAKLSAIVPGKPDKSEMIARVETRDSDLVMPPPHSKLTMSAKEKKILRQWVAQGAKYDTHWAFLPPKKSRLPKIQNKHWPKNAIDYFVLAQLENAKFAPAQTASREKLIRRITFDLTGLPPTLEEIDAFVNDRSANAYEKVVDRLLKSKRFGERMTSIWLDIARYSDSYGYQVDRDRFVWPYRDWLIEAYNKNMPFDEFLTQQLAGDLLPHATKNQILATTFNRLHPQKVEGGSVPEEFRIEYVADRTQTVGTAFLGLTFECARCHDHKYDPISQKEYYQLSAFFDNIDEAGLYSFFTNSVPTPTLMLTDDATKAKLADLDKKIGQQIALLEKRRSQVRLPAKFASKGIPGRILHLDFEKTKGPNKVVDGKVGRAVQLTGDDGIKTKVGNFHRSQPFSISLWLKTPDHKERAVIFHRSRAWTDAGSRGYQLLLEDGKLSASLIHFWPGNAIRVKTKNPIDVNVWHQVTITYDGSSSAQGLKIFLNGKESATDTIRDHLTKTIQGGGNDHITLGERFRDRGFKNGLVDEFQVYDRQLSSLEVAQLFDGKSLQDIVATPDKNVSPRQRAQAKNYYLATADRVYQQQLEVLASLRKKRCQIEDGIPEIMVMREMPTPRPTHVLKRGAYDAPGEKVEPATPKALPLFSNDWPRNRLGLARWLTSPNHPLTARVVVNRHWQMLFGQGLVSTPEDFGSQGRAPTHPQLLDWLAVDLVENDWNIKASIKKIAMSAAYQQSSSATPEKRQRDPENRLFSRGPRYRLSAEMLRDNALAVSGLLKPSIGGPPARPYEVEASFKPVKRQQGAGLYRRSLYTYWKRTAPAPAMMALDASKRDVCRVKRERTSTPLQTFVLMNGPQFVESARVLAEKLLEKHPKNNEALMVDMFRLLTSRKPSKDEQKILRELYSKQEAYFKADASRAQKLLAVGDSPANSKLDANRLAAWAMVANTLMNFDESIMKQ